MKNEDEVGGGMFIRIPFGSKSDKPYKKIMYVEEGSVNESDLKKLELRNPRVLVIRYRKGKDLPVLQKV